STKSKIFCGCKVEPLAEPNTQVCPVCLGFPGVLPVLNRQVVEYALKAAVALNCEITTPNVFERKNYFYPDLPKAYQITQRMLPIGRGGWVEIEVNGTTKRIGLQDVHMEEDTGKSFHGEAAGGLDVSLIDFNRSGVPLLEIISQPDMRSVEEAEAYMNTMRQILLYLGISECRMEAGQLRFEASVSLRPQGEEKFGTRVEIKNLNSFRAVTESLKAEIQRQTAILRKGEAVVQQTMLWNEARGITEPMRSKEYAHDYRYFPEPDLVPLVIDAAWIARVKAELPELPRARKQRFIEQYGLPEYDARVLTASKATADFFEACVREHDNPKAVSNWVMGDFAALLNAEGIDISASKVTPRHLAEMLKLIDAGTITGRMAKDIFEEMFRTGRHAADLAREKGGAIADEAALSSVIEKVIAQNPKAVEDIRAGKDKAYGFLAGQVMKETKGRAHPQVVNRLLREKLQQ
ncbi:MAG: Asp-tRNA(Asn)/Glu-tRNA(Gln) amidotransferase subunit GatB, partial [Abditibacteriales bacterium]|nr:Asp-tRNA(Asn)/Glu-tRNA(Gln) amidotransferase subunit GatB [Abditibacteriales bacterium]MDW8368271.1 Asp-tRNA(Asn)/Glu-tRNA(Gln) amidotransferase subunit GatB [Abditibacteriales bacterium]